MKIWRGWPLKVGHWQLMTKLSEGMAIPKWYGIAYHDYCTAIAYPIPFHIVARVWKVFMGWVKHPFFKRDRWLYQQAEKRVEAELTRLQDYGENKRQQSKEKLETIRVLTIQLQRRHEFLKNIATNPELGPIAVEIRKNLDESWGPEWLNLKDK